MDLAFLVLGTKGKIFAPTLALKSVLGMLSSSTSVDLSSEL